jgi:hypothetical protein
MPANIKTIELRNLQIEDYKKKKSMVESYRDGILSGKNK